MAESEPDPFGVMGAINRRLLKQWQHVQDLEAARTFKSLILPELREMIKAAEIPVLIGPVVATVVTPKALQFKFDGQLYWVPKSVLNHPENEIKTAGDTGMLILPPWIAKLKGFI